MSDVGPTPHDASGHADASHDEPADVAAAGTGSDRAAVDLDAIGRDLAGVEAALSRLEDGSYWTDEVTGEPIPDEVLAADPVARRAGTGEPTR